MHRERIVAVHMENRHLDHLRDVGRIHRRARVFRERGESNLVVHHHMHRAARAVTGQLRHVERFRHNPLPRESRIAMHEQRQNFAPMFRVATNALPRAGRAFHHRIDCFEMARVGRQPNLNFRTGIELPHRAITEMIFHIAIAGDEIGDVVGAEFGEDHAKRFLHEVRQHVEPAAMRHAHADFLHPDRRTSLQNAVENDHERFRALQRKAFLSDVTRMQKRLEHFRFESARAAARSAIRAPPFLLADAIQADAAPSCGCACSGCA